MTKVELTDKNIHNSLMRFSLPLLFISALDFFVVFIDLIWLMTLTEYEGLAAVLKVSISTVVLVESLFAGILGAIYIFANQYYGKGDMDKVRHLLSIGFGYCIALGVVVAFLGSYMGDYLIGLFRISELQADMTSRYLSIFWYGYIVVLLHIYTGLIIKMSGDTKLMVQLKVLAFAINLLITPLFIYVAITLQYDPIKAAALSTVVSRFISFAISLYKIHSSKLFSFPLGLSIVPKRKLVAWKKILQVGISESFNSLSLSLSFFLFFIVVSFYQSHILETVVIAQYITGFFQTLLLGAMGALIPFVSQNAGQRSHVNVRLGVAWMVKRAFIVGIVCMIPIVLLAGHLAGLLTNNQEIISHVQLYVAVTAIPWVCLLASFAYIFAVIGLADSRGILWMTLWSMYLSTLIPLLLVQYLVGDDTLHVALAMAGSYVATFIGCWLYYYLSFERKSSLWSSPQQQQLTVQEQNI
ncbi:MATE family efflux transporter [Rheinheimera sp. NSM]|uniref:MATE family efflux transporter n=1 Tax=Rheinheimera sp. NSM TaxID=3457884 RepID=UPI004036C53A